MSITRRNTITHADAIVITVMAAISAVLAVFSGASPTGTALSDALLVGVLAGAITWLGASAPWWALMAGSGVALIGALPGSVIWIILAAAAFAGSAWIGWTRANQPIARSVIAATVAQVSLRLEWNQFFLASAIIGGAAMGLIGIAGYARRRKYVRKRIIWGAVGVGAFVAIAIAGVGFAAAQARTTARDGYVGLLDGLEYLQDGEIDEASRALQQAAQDLGDAANTLNSPITQLARFVPGAAQNLNTGVEVLADASAASEAAATTLQFVDLDQLTVSNGVVDTGALAALGAPLQDLEATVSDLSTTLNQAESPWLVAPLQSRLDDGIRRADQAAHQAKATAAFAHVGPELLGAEEPRTYLVAFVNNAEARGLGGLMGNWSEVTIDHGRIEITANGRTADLQTESLSRLQLEATNEYLERYGPQGAQVQNGVAQKYWSNVTISPDMPSAGNAMSQMYEAATGRPVDGVFIIDPSGIAALMEVTGSVEVEEIDRRLNSGNVEEFLALGQYVFAESEREDLLTAVTDATIRNVLKSDLPPPQQMAPSLAPAALNGHISGWVVNPDEQELLELVGMDATLPFITTAATDAIAVSSNNSSGNKIESFLERTIEYRPVVNQRTGDVEATMTVSLSNTAPKSGYPDYVIGNIIDEPVGTNRMLLDVYTRLDVQTAHLDGEELPANTVNELGYNVFTTQFMIPPGETAVLVLGLAGNTFPGAYELVYRPQPLPHPDALIINATTNGGETIFDFEGTLERRSVLSADGIRAWRK